MDIYGTDAFRFGALMLSIGFVCGIIAGRMFWQKINAAIARRHGIDEITLEE